MQFDRGPGHQNLHRHRSRVRLLLLPTPQTAAPWEGNSTERAKANKSELD